jgi:ribonuclease T2
VIKRSFWRAATAIFLLAMPALPACGPTQQSKSEAPPTPGKDDGEKAAASTPEKPTTLALTQGKPALEALQAEDQFELEAMATSRPSSNCDEKVGQKYGESGQWMLALSWSQGFCATHPDKAQTDQCAQPTPWARSNFTLHGLWPQWDTYCYPEPRPATECRPWDQLPAPQIDAQVADLLKRVMPGASSGLDRHEWNKHGTCSRLPANDYFRLAAGLVDSVNKTAVAALVRARSGGDVTVKELCDAARKDLGEAGARAMVLELPRKGKPILTGLQFLLQGNDGQPRLDASHVIAPQRPSCGGSEDGSVSIVK